MWDCDDVDESMMVMLVEIQLSDEEYMIKCGVYPEGTSFLAHENVTSDHRMLLLYRGFCKKKEHFKDARLVSPTRQLEGNGA